MVGIGMDRELVYIFLITNLIVSILFYLKNKVEIPLFIAFFNLMVEYRVITLEYGTAEFVSFNYKIDFIFNMDLAYLISNYILLGSSIMLYTFIFFYTKPVIKIEDHNSYLKEFILSKKIWIFVGLTLTSLLQIIFSGAEAGSYSFMIRLANSSFILFFYLLFIYTNTSKISIKLLYFSAFLFFGWLTYSSSLRFQFLGWMIPIGYFMVRKVRTEFKLLSIIPAAFVIIILFSIAGSLRYVNPEEHTTEELYDEGVERLVVSDDINFIDGFMMMYQVYPVMLDHTYGVEHLNIIFRPIPRALWKGKPLAGWFQNYREKYGVEFANIGFSPTIYGVFYAEGGEVGIIIFSIGWGLFLVFFYRKLKSFASELSDLLIGVFLASLIPIFRSGDMAGDFAIVIMSYWPILIFVRIYSRSLNK
jgi:hypothetical protein